MPFPKSLFLARHNDTSPLGGIYISGFSKNGVNVLESRRHIKDYSLVYITKGHGCYTDTNGCQFSLSRGDIFIAAPGVQFDYGPDQGSVWDELYIVFKGPVFDLMHQHGLLHWPQPILHLDAFSYWTERIIIAATSKPDGSLKKMNHEVLQLQTLMIDLLAVAQGNIANNFSWVKRAKEALRAHKLSEDAAKHMGMSYETFRKKFRRLANKSPGQYQKTITMDAACIFLETTTLTIKAIAEKLNYCDEYHFSKQFSKTIGLAPSEYRAKANNKSTGMDH